VTEVCHVAPSGGVSYGPFRRCALTEVNPRCVVTDVSSRPLQEVCRDRCVFAAPSGVVP